MNIFDKAKLLWVKYVTPGNIAHTIHWLFIASGFVISVILDAQAKGDLQTTGIVGTVLSVAQIIHKITDYLDKQKTIQQASDHAVNAVRVSEVRTVKVGQPEIKP